MTMTFSAGWNLGFSISSPRFLGWRLPASGHGRASHWEYVDLPGVCTGEDLSLTPSSCLLILRKVPLLQSFLGASRRETALHQMVGFNMCAVTFMARGPPSEGELDFPFL